MKFILISLLLFVSHLASAGYMTCLYKCKTSSDFGCPGFPTNSFCVMAPTPHKAEQVLQDYFDENFNGGSYKYAVDFCVDDYNNSSNEPCEYIY